MAQDLTMTITSADSTTPTTLEESCLLVFVDETGDEGFSDPRHPVFGLGGAAMTVGTYSSLIRPRWIELKRQHFGGSKVALHACDLRSPTANQLGALGDFFKSELFTRVVAVASSKTNFPDGHPPFELIALSLLKRIERTALRVPITSIALLVESSTRGNSLANRYLGHFDTTQIEFSRPTVSAPVHRYFLQKSFHEPGLEIADFIMNAVGGHARSRLKDPSSPPRKDFAAVMYSVPSTAVEYINITNAELTRVTLDL